MVRGVRLLAAAGLLLALINTISAGPVDGKWKLTVNVRDQQLDLVLLGISDKAGKPEIKIEGTNKEANVFDEAEVVDVSQDKKSLAFTLKTKGPAFRVVAQLGAGAADAKTLRGVILIGDRAIEPVILERTKEKDLGKREVEGVKAVRDLARAEPAEQEKLYKEFQEKHPESSLLLPAAQLILEGRLKGDGKLDAVKGDLARLLTQAALWGDILVAQKQLEIASTLLGNKKHPELALELALAHKTALAKDATVQQTANAISLLGEALKANGKIDEAKKVEAELEALAGKLDAEFEKANIPFEVKAFDGRKGKGTRVALVELFTGSECPPCVAADVAFDASIKAFKPTEAVFLEYHLHIPRPDALTNKASEARQAYYGDEIEGTPTFLIDGKAGPPIGGRKGNAEKGFAALTSAVAKALEVETSAKLNLVVTREGDKIGIEAKADVAKPAAKLKLRLVLVEDVVRYPGGNGQRLHHHVVRDYPGGTPGLAVKEGTTTQKVDVSVKELAEKLGKYVEDFGKDQFTTKVTPPALKKLKIVAFLQDDENKAILQAIQADVPEAK